jgi:thiol-disulfide isomerase/thioredoxin
VGDVIDKNNLAILPAGCRRTQTMAFTMPRGGAGDVTGDTDLLMFTGDNCDHCDQMEPYLRRLEKELGVRVHRFNVWKDQVNFKLFEKLDKGQKCGGLPYFYNVKTQQCVCGATTFGNLRAWAKGKPCNMFYYVPEKRAEDSEEKISKRGVGLLGRFSSKIGEMKEEGVGKVKDRVEEEVRSRKGTDKVEKEVEKSEAKEEIVKN